jgi:catechol 2,3-dioxygenase-like lactoylglutathione lyase family enzyme
MRTLLAVPLFCLFCLLPLCAESAHLSGIAHVAFRVADLDKSRDFYEKLGFEQAFEFKDDTGKVTQAFIKVNDSQFIELYPRKEDSQSLGLMHFCYDAQDIMSVWSAYVKAGLSPREVKKAKAGNLLFILHDPDGQVVEFTQYVTGSLHSEDRGKHLGEHRISDHLQGATLFVKDVIEERAFYADKLGFPHESGVDQTVLRVGRDELKLEPARAKVNGEISFEVTNIRHAFDALRDFGVAPKMVGETVQVNDHDGVIIVFARAARESKH